MEALCKDYFLGKANFHSNRLSLFLNNYWRPSKSSTSTISCIGTSSPTIFSSTTASSNSEISASAKTSLLRTKWLKPCSAPRSTWPLKFSKAKSTPIKQIFGLWESSFIKCCSDTAHSSRIRLPNWLKFLTPSNWNSLIKSPLSSKI